MFEIIRDYQTLIAGFSALGAAALTARYLHKQIKNSVEEGKRERAFRMKQHEIEMQTKRYATAVMLEADIRSIDELANLESLAKCTKEDAETLEHLNDDKSIALPLFPLVGKLVLSNYSHYIKNIPLMRVETVKEVSQLYILATTLFEVMEMSNAKIGGGLKIEGLAVNKTRASFLTDVSDAAKSTKNQIEQTLPWLVEEVADAQKELGRLNSA